MDKGKLEEKMKTKIIIMLALISFTFSCALMKESGKEEEPVIGEIQQEEVLSEPAAQEVEPTLETVVPPSEMVSVIASVVNIRSGPGMQNKVITTVRMGDELELLGENGSWCNVRLLNGAEGWIYKKFVR
ncbi:MAG: SH3 domain-containing protein [Syntrophobacterales bacterium]|nr:MAG: SH3 domain-containing protein [Syntrophobacterales bacterium]